MYICGKNSLKRNNSYQMLENSEAPLKQSLVWTLTYGTDVIQRSPGCNQESISYDGILVCENDA